MPGVNKVILIGYLGKDPERRVTQSAKSVTRFSLATAEKWGGEERTEWHNIVCFGRTADIADQYLRKGSRVYIEGRIQNRSWEDQNGGKKYMTEIIVNNLTMLGDGKTTEAAKTEPRTNERPQTYTHGRAQSQNTLGDDWTTPGHDNDDIPF